MTDHEFKLLIDRLNEIQDHNRSLKDWLLRHESEDRLIHDKVKRHDTYFTLFGLGVPSVTALLGYLFGRS